MSATWLITLVTVVVAVCAALAAMGFQGRVTTVGIDLGTTFSVVGVNINGKVLIIEDKEGHRIFPSVVSYQDNGDITAVAYAALPYLSIRPENTIFNAKRFLGGNLNDSSTQSYASAHPYKVVESNLSKHSKVGFELSDDKIVTPENVGTEVLKYLLSITATFMGHKQVNKAVIAVPAKFTSEQRAATGEAFKAAGLKVIRVLEEPTAAAVAYNLHKKSDVHHILVYDFGGGTLDVSLLFVSNGSVQVYATDGDETLGGSDLDVCLYGIIKEKVEIELGEELVLRPTGVDFSHSDHIGDKYKDLCAAPSVRTMSEEIKKLLSYSVSSPFRLDLELGLELELGLGFIGLRLG
jgi:molecular chaperone DnaK (HSP70)